MNPDVEQWIRRSIEAHILAAWSVSGVAVHCTGQALPNPLPAAVVWLAVGTVRWQPSHQASRRAEVDVDAQVFVRNGSNVHRLEELAGALRAILDRAEIALMDYPAAEPEQRGGIRLGDAQIAYLEPSAGYQGATEIPLRQANVSATATVCLDTADLEE